MGFGLQSTKSNAAVIDAGIEESPRLSMKSAENMTSNFCFNKQRGRHHPDARVQSQVTVRIYHHNDDPKDLADLSFAVSERF